MGCKVGVIVGVLVLVALGDGVDVMVAVDVWVGVYEMSVSVGCNAKGTPVSEVKVQAVMEKQKINRMVIPNMRWFECFKVTP